MGLNPWRFDSSLSQFHKGKEQDLVSTAAIGKTEPMVRNGILKRFTSAVIFIIVLIGGVGGADEQKIWLGPSVDFGHGDLKVSENKRFIVHTDGTPFF